MRVPKKGMLCGWCGHPVIRHMLAVEEFIPDTREGADPGRLRKQLYHKKRCWSKELRARLDEKRADERLLHSMELAKKALEDAGGATEIAGGRLSESQLIDLALREVGRQKPGLVSERARLVTVGEDEVPVDTLIQADDPETGTVGAIYELPPEKERRPMLRHGEAIAGVTLLIEQKKGGWWSTQQLCDEMASQLNLQTTLGSVQQTITMMKRRGLQVEHRWVSGKKEWRVIQTDQPATPPALPEDPARTRERKLRQVEERHSNRPTFWEKQAEGAGKKEGTVVTFDRYEQIPEPAIDVTPEPVNEDVARALARQEEFNEWQKLREQERAMTTANGHAKEMFILKSERMLNELERTMTDLVREAIENARKEIKRLVEQELTHE